MALSEGPLTSLPSSSPLLLSAEPVTTWAGNRVKCAKLAVFAG